MTTISASKNTSMDYSHHDDNKSDGIMITPQGVRSLAPRKPTLLRRRSSDEYDAVDPTIATLPTTPAPPVTFESTTTGTASSSGSLSSSGSSNGSTANTVDEAGSAGIFVQRAGSRNMFMSAGRLIIPRLSLSFGQSKSRPMDDFEFGSTTVTATASPQRRRNHNTTTPTSDARAENEDDDYDAVFITRKKKLPTTSNATSNNESTGPSSFVSSWDGAVGESRHQPNIVTCSECGLCQEWQPNCQFQCQTCQKKLAEQRSQNMLLSSQVVLSAKSPRKLKHKPQPLQPHHPRSDQTVLPPLEEGCDDDDEEEDDDQSEGEEKNDDNSNQYNSRIVTPEQPPLSSNNPRQVASSSPGKAPRRFFMRRWSGPSSGTSYGTTLSSFTKGGGELSSPNNQSSNISTTDNYFDDTSGGSYVSTPPTASLSYNVGTPESQQYEQRISVSSPVQEQQFQNVQQQ